MHPKHRTVSTIIYWNRKVTLQDPFTLSGSAKWPFFKFLKQIATFFNMSMRRSIAPGNFILLSNFRHFSFSRFSKYKSYLAINIISNGDCDSEKYSSFPNRDHCEVLWTSWKTSNKRAVFGASSRFRACSFQAKKWSGCNSHSTDEAFSTPATLIWRNANSKIFHSFSSLVVKGRHY